MNKKTRIILCLYAIVLSTGAKTDIITKKEVAQNKNIPNNNKPDVNSKAVDEKDIWDFPIS